MYYVIRSITPANNDFPLGNPTFFTKSPLTHLTYPENHYSVPPAYVPCNSRPSHLSYPFPHLSYPVLSTGPSSAHVPCSYRLSHLTYPVTYPSHKQVTLDPSHITTQLPGYPQGYLEPREPEITP